MTKQETFDFVCKSVIAQGMPAQEGGGCLYRAKGPEDKTLKCAAGFLITDEEFAKLDKQDGERVYGTVTSNQEINKLLREKGHDITLVQKLQRAHDNAEWGAGFVQSFKRRAIEVAAEFELNAEVVQ